ncbi:MAG: zinc ribbon domain-containing protein [Bacteroidales bacterium]
MNKCGKCDTNNPDNSKYCMNCGYEIEKKISQETTTLSSIPVKEKSNKKRLATIIGAAIGIAIMFNLQYFVFKTQSPSIDTALQQFASEINKSCPIMIDSETRFDNAIALPNKMFAYNFTLINLQKETVDTLQIRNQIEPRIINIVKTNPEMEYVRARKVNLSYNYKDKNGVYLFQIVVTPKQYE